jgi:hypothetical protein
VAGAPFLFSGFGWFRFREQHAPQEFANGSRSCGNGRLLSTPVVDALHERLVDPRVDRLSLGMLLLLPLHRRYLACGTAAVAVCNSKVRKKEL